MKRATIAVLALVLSLALSACGAASSLPQGSESSEATAPSSSESLAPEAPSQSSPEDYREAPLLSEAEYAAIRAGIDAGPAYGSYMYYDEFFRDVYPVELDDTGKQILYFLSLYGYMSGDVTMPQDYDPDEALSRFLRTANILNTYDNGGGKDRQAILTLIAGAYRTGENKYLGQESMVILKEQVDAAAAAFFGEGCTVEHKSCDIWIYHPLVGIYTPIPTELYGVGTPVILDYTVEPDSIKVLLTYFGSDYGGLSDLDSPGISFSIFDDPGAAGQAKEYFRNDAKRRTVTISVGGDGSWHFVSHIME